MEFFCLMLVSSYTANLAAFLTSNRLIEPIENVEQLSRQSKIKYGIVGNGSTQNFFRVNIFFFLSFEINKIILNLLKESKLHTYQRLIFLLSFKS